MHAKVCHNLESTDQDKPVVGEQNERLSNCSDALDDVIDASSTGLSLTGCVTTEPATNGLTPLLSRPVCLRCCRLVDRIVLSLGTVDRAN